MKITEFWNNVEVRPSGCWEYVGTRNQYNYGTFRVDGERGMRIASRYMQELCRGPIPKGILVCHTCDNPPCVNPDHLFVGTPAQNHGRQDAKGPNAEGRGARKRTSHRREGPSHTTPPR